MILNRAVFFGARVIFHNGDLDLFALAVAAVSFMTLQRLKVPVYLLVPVGAVLGMVWTLL